MRKRNFTFAVLAIRNFRLLWLTRVFSLMALQAQAVIVGWQVYSITKDPFLLGLTGLAEAVPALSCALFAGHIVDISVPRRIFSACLFVLALNTLALYLVAGGVLESDGYVLPFIYGAIVVSGFARSFIMPATFVLQSQIVPRHELPAASAWLNSGFQFATIVSPAVAGIVYGGYGPHGAWLMPLSMMLCAFALALSLNVEKAEKTEKKRLSALHSIREGWGFILKTPVLLSAMAVDMLAVLFGGAVALLPAFAAEILHVGPQGLGLLRSAPAVGAIVVALYLAARPFQSVHGKWLLWVIGGFGVCMVGFGLSTHFWLSLLFLTLSGAFDSAGMVIRSTLMQLLTPDDMRGRVSSVSSMFIISSNELGAFESGVVARLMGLAPSVVAGGFSAVLVTGLISLFSPSLRTTVVHAQKAQ